MKVNNCVSKQAESILKNLFSIISCIQVMVQTEEQEGLGAYILSLHGIQYSIYDE